MWRVLPVLLIACGADFRLPSGVVLLGATCEAPHYDCAPGAVLFCECSEGGRCFWRDETKAACLADFRIDCGQRCPSAAEREAEIAALVEADRRDAGH